MKEITHCKQITLMLLTMYSKILPATNSIITRQFISDDWYSAAI